jgi:hypothetical protein
VLTDPECYSTEKQKKSAKKTTSMSLGESAKYLASSKYIRDLATLVIAYGACVRRRRRQHPILWNPKIACGSCLGFF